VLSELGADVVTDYRLRAHSVDRTAWAAISIADASAGMADALQQQADMARAGVQRQNLKW
jgi:hypothetical protein